jgi:flagellar hook-length control protein FliK
MPGAVRDAAELLAATAARPAARAEGPPKDTDSSITPPNDLPVAVTEKETHHAPSPLRDILQALSVSEADKGPVRVSTLLPERGEQEGRRSDPTPNNAANGPAPRVESAAFARVASATIAPAVASATITPTAQVATAILRDISPSPASSAPRALPAASSPTEPVRILKVALDPPELGQVMVRLRLTGQSLELKVTAERPETAAILERDRHALARILRASGYEADGISVQSVSQASGTDGSSVQNGFADPQSSGQPAQQFQPNGSNGGERRGAQPQGDQHASQRTQENQSADADSNAPRGGALYV